MKFVCDKCKTKYSIADEKVRRKVLKIRCKNCSNIIVVKEPVEAAPRRDAFGTRPTRGKRPSASLEPVPSLWGPGRAEPALVDDFEPEQTRLSEVPDFADLELGQPSEDDWYLAVDGNQYGPMAFTELCSRIKRGETGDEAFVWRESFNDWVDLQSVPELQPYIPIHPPPPPRGKSGLYNVPAAVRSRTSSQVGPVSPLPQAPAPAPRLPQAPQVPELRGQRRSGTEHPAVAVPQRPVQPPVVQARPAQPSHELSPVGLSPQPQPLPTAAPAPTFQELVQKQQQQQQSISAPPISGDSDLRPLPQPVADAGLGPVSGAGVAPAPTSRTPTIMIVAGIGGGLAALCGLFLVGYSLLIDRPEQDPKPAAVAANVAREVHPTPGAPEVAAPDASAGTEIEFLPMEVERSKTRMRSVGRSSRHRSPAPKPRRRTAEEERLLKLYRKSGGPAGAAPAIDTKGPPRDQAARRIKPAELLALQRKNKSSLKACYERALKRDESLSELKAEVTVTIGDSGVVRRVSIRAGNNPELTTCIQRSIRRWAFPAIGAQSFSFPIIFRGS